MGAIYRIHFLHCALPTIKTTKLVVQEDRKREARRLPSAGLAFTASADGEVPPAALGCTSCVGQS